MSAASDKNRAGMLRRLEQYAGHRDGGMRPADAGRALGVSRTTAQAYERWYRRERLGLPGRPRDGGVVRAMSAYRIGSLCTGYGGLDMAVESVLGGELAWVADIDPGACKILAHRFPSVPNLGDITAIDWAAVEPVDILLAGFPCQDISDAGKRAGIDGARSGIWRNVADAIRVLRPRLVVLENVRALLVRGLGRVLSDLAAIGFDAEWGVLRASEAGAPHQRARVFVIAWPAQDAHCAASRERRQPAPGQAEGWRTRADVGRSGGAPAADAAGERCKRQREPETARAADWRRQLGSGQPAGPGASAPADTDSDGLARSPERDSEPQRGQARDEQRRVDPLRRVLDWGSYGPAVVRWAAVLGRPAPRPTEPGRTGERLSPAFVEWMMGLPAGWVTDVPGLSRNQHLHALGNGVVPQQAAMALRLLLGAIEAGRAA